MAERRRTPTSTSNFGVGKREGHDASGFYGRFRGPEISDDDTVLAPAPVVEPFVCGDTRSMDAIVDGSVALVVTSPPYFAGKQYEEELTRDGIPSSYVEYLDLLRDVFTECVRTLEPGGRIAVNVANLGRKPYRSLSSDVIRILQDDLGLLLRGELIWQKGEGANGSCAWGSFRSAANPVLRDVSERVIVASKGRFDRAKNIRDRQSAGLPHANSILTEDFLNLTLDIWSIPPESARRVGHPAPFPVELPEQLIRLYTFENDLVLDPFMGSGSAMIAAAATGRRYIGYDTDQEYVDLARSRVAAALEGIVNDTPSSPAIREGKAAPKLAAAILADAGFEVVDQRRRIKGTGVTVDIVATDRTGTTWYFDVAGSYTSHRGGMQRSDVAWKAVGRAAALTGRGGEDIRLVLLTTNPPKRRSEGDTAIRAVGHEMIFDVIDLQANDDRQRLASYADGSTTPSVGFWAKKDLERGGE